MIENVDDNFFETFNRGLQTFWKNQDKWITFLKNQDKWITSDFSDWFEPSGSCWKPF